MICVKKNRLSNTERAIELIKELSLEEKVSLMGGNGTFEEMLATMDVPGRHYNDIPYAAGGVEKKELPPMLFCDGPRGVVCGTGESTCFPVTMLRGATFDVELEEKIGRAIGKETRAFGGNTFAGVCINLPYNPGWGRSQETYGEESFHLGEMGSALVRGVQGENTIACVKHYAFNQMEISRFKVNVECDIRTEREVFLPHFKKCVDRGAASIMSSYNMYKGTYCGHHNYLLNEVLKDEWGFDGFIMSDFGWGVRDTVEAANGGQNIEMNCTTFFGDKLVEAVKEGKVPESKIDDAALRIVRTLLAFEDAYNNGEKVDRNVAGCEEHIQLALEAARKGITLVKNDNHTLPLNKDKTKEIVVLGALGSREVIGDHGSSRVFPKYVISPKQGIANVADKTEVIYYDGENIEHAKELARNADAVIFVVGYDHDDEGEFISEDIEDAYIKYQGGDRRYSLGLHEKDITLLNEVGPINSKSTAILIGGNMIMMEEWKDSVGAVMMAYYAGMEGGTAMAEILFGEVNPSGKLPYVVPYDETDLPQVEWDTRAITYDYYHGYAKLEKEGIEPYLPYGFGLSYTTFQYDEAEFNIEKDNVVASCKLVNTGDRKGMEIVQMYVGFKNSKVDRPVKLLRGFKRIELEVGQSKIVEIQCPFEDLTWYNPDTEKMELEHMEYEVYIGSSSDNKDLLQGIVGI
ncbi:MAG TPA: glycosyl hydrolase [Epulopiscium sp.]|nr:glycosyl hydrolase [Candidatus Epulonipiscium sp.]